MNPTVVCALVIIFCLFVYSTFFYPGNMFGTSGGSRLTCCSAFQDLPGPFRTLSDDADGRIVTHWVFLVSISRLNAMLRLGRFPPGWQRRLSDASERRRALLPCAAARPRPPAVRKKQNAASLTTRLADPSAGELERFGPDGRTPGLGLDRAAAPPPPPAFALIPDWLPAPPHVPAPCCGPSEHQRTHQL